MGVIHPQSQLIREPGLLIPRRKPVGPVRVSPQPPFRVDHLWGFDGAFGGKDSAGTHDLTEVVGPPEVSGTKVGEGYGDYTPTLIYNGVYAPALGPTLQLPCTVFLHCRVTDVQSIPPHSPFVLYTDNSREYWHFFFNDDNANEVNISFRRRDGAINNSTPYSADKRGQDVFLAGEIISDSLTKFWADGKFIGSDTATMSVLGAEQIQANIGNTNFGFATAQNEKFIYYMAGISFQSWSDELHKSMGKNPYQFLQPA